MMYMEPNEEDYYRGLEEAFLVFAVPGKYSMYLQQKIHFDFTKLFQYLFRIMVLLGLFLWCYQIDWTFRGHDIRYDHG